MNEYDFTDYHAPKQCSKCQGTELIYNGLGEYCCQTCDNKEYDDYGKVRNYLDVHKGVPIAMIAKETGVTKDMIRHMVSEERFDICQSTRRTL